MLACKRQQVGGHVSKMGSPKVEAQDGICNYGHHYIGRLDFCPEGMGAKSFMGRIKSYLHLRKITNCLEWHETRSRETSLSEVQVRNDEDKVHKV